MRKTGIVRMKEICAMVWICVCPQIHILNLTPEVMVLGGGAHGMWLVREAKAMVIGISALIKETLES